MITSDTDMASSDVLQFRDYNMILSRSNWVDSDYDVEHGGDYIGKFSKIGESDIYAFVEAPGIRTTLTQDDHIFHMRRALEAMNTCCNCGALTSIKKNKEGVYLCRAHTKLPRNQKKITSRKFK